MTRIRVSSGVELEHETFGSADDPTVLLIAGFGAQLISWADGFCERLADGGRFVVRYDHRDIGLSSGLTDAPVDLGELMGAAMAGDTERVQALAPYTLMDLADDAVALLDALGVDTAHVVGASMGGMVAQHLAIRHPARVATLTSMMSSTGESEHGQSTPEAMGALLAPPAPDREAHIAQAVEAARIWSSCRHFDADAAAAFAASAYDRAHRPDGVARQLAALLASGSTADGLAALQIPTLVIHGLDDTLITPSGGERTAELVPGARLMMVPDMGHDRPEPLWPLLCDAILDHTTVRTR